jgi:aldehyde dehydrogenase (NAD+)
MKNFEQLYIDGHWVNSHGNAQLEVINPADGELYASVPSADVQDVDIAIRAASKAFSSWSDRSDSSVDGLSPLFGCRNTSAGCY